MNDHMFLAGTINGLYAVIAAVCWFFLVSVSGLSVARSYEAQLINPAAGASPSSVAPASDITRIPTDKTLSKLVEVRASAEENNINRAVNVLGQDLGTRWSAKGDEQWIELVFKEPRAIDYVDLAFFKGRSRRAYFDIVTSVDGEVWENQISDGVSSGKSEQVQRFSFLTTEAKIIRYVGYGNNSNEAATRPWNSLTVFSVGSNKTDINNGYAKGLSKNSFARWKLVFPDLTEANNVWLTRGLTRANIFYYDAKGGAVFRAANLTPALADLQYSRTELREMLLGNPPKEKLRGYTKNNWVLSVADQVFRSQVGGVDARLEATLAVNNVSSTGDVRKVGRIVVAQINASSDKPLRLMYRLRSGHAKGSVYMSTSTRGNKVRWYSLVGNKAWKPYQEEPQDGIVLNELWSYTIAVEGYKVSVTIEREGMQTVTKRFKMHAKFKNEWMYFTAGNRNTNNTGSPYDYSQVSIYRLIAAHD